MGGGAGVSLHGRFRVATENTVYTRNQNQVMNTVYTGVSYVVTFTYLFKTASSYEAQKVRVL
jgi:enoyl-CoA hydratase/carnithine racemase